MRSRRWRKLAVTGYCYEVVELTNAGASSSGLALPAPIPQMSCLYVASAAGGERVFPNPNPEQLSTAARELGSACNTLSGKIAYVHAQTEITVAVTIAAIGVTVAVTIAAIGVTVAAALGLTVFTFGISDAVGVAGVAGETAGAAATITGFITRARRIHILGGRRHRCVGRGDGRRQRGHGGDHRGRRG